jgi:hypothetical protein
LENFLPRALSNDHSLDNFTDYGVVRKILESLRIIIAIEKGDIKSFNINQIDDFEILERRYLLPYVLLDYNHTHDSLDPFATSGQIRLERRFSINEKFASLIIPEFIAFSFNQNCNGVVYDHGEILSRSTSWRNAFKTVDNVRIFVMSYNSGNKSVSKDDDISSNKSLLKTDIRILNFANYLEPQSAISCLDGYCDIFKKLARNNDFFLDKCNEDLSKKKEDIVKFEEIYVCPICTMKQRDEDESGYISVEDVKKMKLLCHQMEYNKWIQERFTCNLGCKNIKPDLVINYSSNQTDNSENNNNDITYLEEGILNLKSSLNSSKDITLGNALDKKANDNVVIDVTNHPLIVNYLFLRLSLKYNNQYFSFRHIAIPLQQNSIKLNEVLKSVSDKGLDVVPWYTVKLEQIVRKISTINEKKLLLNLPNINLDTMASPSTGIWGRISQISGKNDGFIVCFNYSLDDNIKIGDPLVDCDGRFLGIIKSKCKPHYCEYEIKNNIYPIHLEPTPEEFHKKNITSDQEK